MTDLELERISDKVADALASNSSQITLHGGTYTIIDDTIISALAEVFAEENMLTFSRQRFGRRARGRKENG